ncbi:MAG: MBL fold metallo-hydrolase [Candidatus Latescibacterota bacterium]
MIFKTLPVGDLQANCYLVGSEETREAVVIDPGGSEEAVLTMIREAGVTVTALINTHAHCDHIGANARVHKVTGAPILIHESEAAYLTDAALNGSAFFHDTPILSPPADRLLHDGDGIRIGSETMTVLHTPGHSPGGISLVLGDFVFTGDTLFRASIGRTDLPGASYDTLMRSIRERLMTLDDDVQVFPGHGEASTIGWERLHNPWII